MILEAANNNLFELIKGSDKPVLVDFYAEWCGPCKAMEPLLSEIAYMYRKDIYIIKVDVDKNLENTLACRVMGVPTFMIYKNGVAVWQRPDVLTKKELIDYIEQYRK